MTDYLESYGGKTILITGGCGCIGSNLVRELLKANVKKIHVMDDLSSSYKWNIPKDSKITFFEGSVIDDKALRIVFSKKPDYVFHLAALFANQNSIDHPEKDLMVNGLGILRVLQHSQSANVEKVLYASSGCSVYGNKAPLPLKEDFVSLHLDTPYQITKLLGELYCNFFFNYYELPVVIGRFFNVYGPGEVPGKYRNVIPNFVFKALHHQPLPITGTGEETRDFTYVEDIVDGVLRAVAVEEALGEAINLASGTETRVIDIANMVNDIAGNSQGVTFVERREWDNIVRRRASIEKAKKILGYNPKIDIKDGIKRTFSWFIDHMNLIEASARF